jgi:hypothetical protein
MGAVKLKDIIDALQVQFDDHLSFLNLDTDEIEGVNRQLLGEAEETDEEESEDDDEDWALAKRIAGSDRYVRLPTNHDIHEWQIMADFARAQEGDLMGELLNALHRTHAYRHFKDVIRQSGVEQDWYRFRDQALREIAIEWCGENNIPWK